ncbi:hypothetical protein DASB73_011740 [Starmerella bacillaris]|uniref:Amine oxidase n=1 Tax=Starmerella bacillaris TaxID=1247836 RepID=A0AAV5RHZ4_STABA|nr:hypothetical protein DASB73_011740 [Starmerella bacillaris]
MSSPIIIIGAGTAGLSAAQYLQKQGKDYVILEGRDRLGGRVHTLNDKDHENYELGAAWFHEVPHNKLTDIAEENGVESIFDDVNVEFHDSKGKLDQNLVATITNKFNEYRDSRQPDTTLERAADTFVSGFKNADERQAALSVVNRFVLSAGIPLGNVNTRFGLPLPKDERRDKAVQNYSKFVTDVLASDVDRQKIKLNVQVTGIVSDNEGVTVTTESGERIKGASVIVTVPIGVLKKNVINFEPELDHNLQSAINNYAVTRVEKVYMTFKEPFWKPEVFKFIVSDENIQALVWNWSAAHPSSENRNTIAILVAGNLAASVEKNKQHVYETLKPVLEAIAVKEISEPHNVVMSDWYFDKFSHGSYSTVPNEQTREGLVSPFVNQDHRHRVFFAGEHTIVEGAGYVQGAYDSGIRAAKQALA